jgi:hypothetical protein
VYAFAYPDLILKNRKINKYTLWHKKLTAINALVNKFNFDKEIQALVLESAEE